MAADDRSPLIVHWREVPEPDDCRYPGSDELLGIGAPVGAATGLAVMAFTTSGCRRPAHLLAACRARSRGVRLSPGRAAAGLDRWRGPRSRARRRVGFPKGTGTAHTFLNNTDADVRLLVVGEKSSRLGIHYPLHPVRNAEIGARH